MDLYGMREHHAAVVRSLCRLSVRLRLIGDEWRAIARETVTAVRERTQRELGRAVDPKTFRAWCGWLERRHGLVWSGGRGPGGRTWTLKVDERAAGMTPEPEPQRGFEKSESGARLVLAAYPDKGLGRERDDLFYVHDRAARMANDREVEGDPYAHLAERAEMYARSESATKDGGRYVIRLRRWLRSGGYAYRWDEAPAERVYDWDGILEKAKARKGGGE
jgi:hypothetical protein